MRNAYFKNFMRQIWRAPSRFLSLLFITALGTAIYAGVSFASPDMRETAIEYFNEQKLADINIVNFGATDFHTLAEELGGDFTVEQLESIDFYIKNSADELFVTRIFGLNDGGQKLNIPVLIEGRLPEKSSECMVERSVLRNTGKKIGDTVTVVDDGLSTITFETYLRNAEFTIVGICESPLYITADKGNTYKGNGTVAAYMYIPEQAIHYGANTVYVRENGDKKYFSAEYEKRVEEITARIEEINQKVNEKITKENEEALKENPDVQVSSPSMWRIENASHNTGYSGFQDDTKSLSAIAAVFPIIFFLVAALVGLTTMTRMVEERRNEIGIYKSLGYSSGAIAWQYAGYALLIAVLGSLIGFFGGRFPLSYIIFDAYNTLYRLPEICYSDNPKFLVIGVAASIACLVGAALVTAAGELIQTPANLLRPKPPAKGQRIFLERITFIWKRLKFTKKVTARNLMRYKQRFFMTVIGIAGCMALLLTGFGLRDSVSDMAPVQFDEIFLYDAQMFFQDRGADTENERLKNFIEDNENIDKYMFIRQNTMTVYNDENDKFVDVYCVVPENISETKNYITMRERKNRKNEIEMDDEGVVISEKITSLLGVSKGDEITLKDSSGSYVKVKISAVTEHYIEHYIYVSPNLYEKLYGEKPLMNTYIMKFTPLESEDAEQKMRDEFSEELRDYPSALYVSYSAKAKDRFSDMVDVMNFVIWVLIISAGGLAFTVLFNLTNINIAERARELATIRVLGFHMSETASYIYRENAVLTLFGIAAGCVAGYWMHLFVTVTAEVELAMFCRDIHLESYAYSIAITILFAVFVNLVMLFKLKKINMVESLKSVE